MLQKASICRDIIEIPMLSTEKKGGQETGSDGLKKQDDMKCESTEFRKQT